jgi:hypothetical protein
MAAEAFLDGDDGIQINMSKKEIKLSMIFKWYREDFGKTNDEVGYFISCWNVCWEMMNE